MELRLYRNLAVEIDSAFSCDLLRKLEHREVDVALVASPPSNAIDHHSLAGRAPVHDRFLRTTIALAAHESVGLAM